jgi:hypothetical protein
MQAASQIESSLGIVNNSLNRVSTILPTESVPVIARAATDPRSVVHVWSRGLADSQVEGVFGAMSSSLAKMDSRSLNTFGVYDSAIAEARLSRALDPEAFLYLDKLWEIIRDNFSNPDPKVSPST